MRAGRGLVEKRTRLKDSRFRFDEPALPLSALDHFSHGLHHDDRVRHRDPGAAGLREGAALFALALGSSALLVGIFSLVQLVSSPIFGKLSDRIGRKPVLIVSILGTAVGFFVLGIARTGWMLFLGRIIDGISGGNIATAQTCIADVTPPEERSRAMGTIGAAFGLGFIMGPALGGLLGSYSPTLPFLFLRRALGGESRLRPLGAAGNAHPGAPPASGRTGADRAKSSREGAACSSACCSRPR